MAYIQINDVFDELREEVNRLSKENEIIFRLLEKYRNFLINIQNICICNQNTNYNNLVKSFENEYKSVVQNLKPKNHFIDLFDTQLKTALKDSTNYGESYDNDLKNEDISDRFSVKKTKEENDSQSDYGSEQLVDNSFSDGSDEEFITNSKKPKLKKKGKCGHRTEEAQEICLLQF